MMRIVAAAIALALSAGVLAHGGGLDGYDCHHNRKAGGYHCHRGALAGESFGSQQEMIARIAKAAPAPARKATKGEVRNGR